ncbi:hypothetical protein PEX2_042660 [Penicillium expansum]|uniref:Uncharacterized protein n=1 Tax=Penicillium expansum TaxID=27334 RepID=A0A0A2IDT7_PENEN|nr:hypothetical protein PEX2_042660 [Penicillium expansum]KGO40593.1 hypothetical protein PEXP_070970 [Penicillium expansum]KGO63066.1 hypothetical protein PEX2_042660 [Penicillium expansum]
MGFLSGKLRSKPQRKLSEPTYETPAYGQQPVIPSKNQHEPNKYGPHFQKGPQQEEIYKRRANGERIPPGHPDLHDRAHSFHQPRQHHAYSDPFETRPGVWSNQMDAKHKKYHFAGDIKDPQALQNHVDTHEAHHLRVGPKHPFIPAHGPMLKTGIAAAQAMVTRENLVVQGREGFVQKYPQAYKTEMALERHDREVGNRRRAAEKKRTEHTTLSANYDKWAREAQKQR